MPWNDVFWLAGLVVSCILGLLLVVLQLPGTWVIAAATAGYAWHGQFRQITTTLLAIVIGTAVAAEIVEFLASMMTAKRAGASRRAGWFGLIGGIIGMFALSVPIPVVGSVIGGLLGCFAGALFGELTLRNDMESAVRIGFAAAIGRVLGLAAKLGMAVAMSGVAIASALMNRA